MQEESSRAPPIIAEGHVSDLNDAYRVKTTTSSQRTLRYNDFELVQKEAQNDAKYQLHVDEGDEKDSSRAGES